MGERQIRKLTEGGSSVGSRDLILYRENWWGSINQDVQPCDQQQQLVAVRVIPTVHPYGICTGYQYGTHVGDGGNSTCPIDM